MRKKIIIISIISVLIIAGSVFYFNNQTIQTETLKLEKQDAMITVLATGKVVSSSLIPLSFSTSGQVQHVHVEEGTQVKKGQTLIALENSQARNLIKQRETAYQQANLNLAKLNVSDYPQGLEKIKQAESAVDVAEKNLTRSQTLFDAGALSQVELESAQTNLDNASSALQIEQNNLNTIKNSLEPLALNSLEQANVLLAEARIKLEDSSLKAPVSGRVIEKNIDVGEFAQAGQKVLTLVPEDSKTYFEIQADEEERGRLDLGQEAVISVSAFPEEIINAKIVKIAPTIDPERGTFTIRLAAEQRQSKLVPDLTVEAQIIIGTKKQVYILEQQYLKKDKDEEYLYLLKDGMAVKRLIKTADLGNGYLEIIQGINRDETILLNDKLEDGQKVEVKEDKKAKEDDKIKETKKDEQIKDAKDVKKVKDNQEVKNK